jgi:hypothetical protein
MHARHEFDDTTNGYYFLNNTIISPEKSGVFYNPRILYSEDSSLLYVDQDNVPLICLNNLIAYPGSDYASGPTWKGEAECYFDFNAINTRDAQIANIHHNVKTRDLDTVGVLDSLNNDYSPSGVTSYLYNTGYDVSLYNVTIDHNDIPRPQHVLFDIGAYEYNDLHVGPLEHHEQIFVYPNPFEDCITLKHNDANVVSLFDLYGKCVYKNVGNKNQTHCFDHLDSGLYFLSIHGSGPNRSLKIVKR